MKMAKKLLAVALAGVLALSVLTGCGSSSSKSTSIVDAMNDILKGDPAGITVKTDSDLTAKVKTMTTWKSIDAEALTAVLEEDKNEEEGVSEAAKRKIMSLLGDNYKDQYVWFSMTPTNGYSNIAQASILLKSMDDFEINVPAGKDKETIEIYRIGTATMNYEGKPVCIALIAAEAEDADEPVADGKLEILK